MTRPFRRRWLLVLVVFAFATATWCSTSEGPDVATDAPAHGDALALAPHAHAGVATVATRAPVSCARSEQSRREIVHLDPCIAGPAVAIRPAGTPLYALLRVFRL